MPENAVLDKEEQGALDKSIVNYYDFKAAQPIRLDEFINSSADTSSSDIIRLDEFNGEQKPREELSDIGFVGQRSLRLLSGQLTKIAEPTPEIADVITASFVKESPIGIAQRIAENKAFLSEEEKEMADRHPVARTIGELSGNILTYTLAAAIPGVGVPVAFGAAGMLSKTAEIREQPELNLQVGSNLGRIAVRGIADGITGKIFSQAQKGATILQRLLWRSSGAGATTITSSIVDQAIASKGQEVDAGQAILDGAFQAVVIGAVGAISEIPQLRGIIIKEAETLTGKTGLSLAESKAIVKSAGIKPESLSPEFQRHIYETKRAVALQNIRIKAKNLGYPPEIIENVVRAQNIRERDNLLTDYLSALVKVNPAKAEKLMPFYNAIKNGADPVDILIAQELVQYIKPKAQIEKVISEADLYPKAGGKIHIPEVIEPFYSKMRMALAQKMPEQAPVSQIRGILASAQIPQEEIEWSGVEDFLKGKDKISKTELLDYLQKNQMTIEETIKGGTTYPQRVKEIEQEFSSKGYSINREPGGEIVLEEIDTGHEVSAETLAMDQELSKLADEYTALKGEFDKEIPSEMPKYSDPKYNVVTENYRELLLKVSQEVKQIKPEQVTIKEIPPTKEWVGKYHGKDYDILVDGEKIVDVTNTLDTPEQIKAQFIREQNEGLEKEARVSGYKEPHWDEPNVFAHARMADVTDEQGRKGLFINEVQSEWMLDARKKGFQKFWTKEEVNKFTVKDNPEQNSWEVYDGDGNRIASPPKQFNKTANEALKLIRDSAVKGILKSDMVPYHPVVSRWQEVILKRLLRYAAENGYDFIAWASGEQVAGYYNLAKYVDAIRYQKAKDFIEIEIIKDDKIIESKHFVFLESNKELVGKQLADFVGKDIADRIMKGEGKKTYPESRRARPLFVISGEGLKVGGEWAHNLYDRQIPNWLNDYGKKFGVKVEAVKIGEDLETIPEGWRWQKVGSKWWLRNKAGYADYFCTTKEEALHKLYKDYPHYKKQITSQQSLPITQQMKQSLLYEGQPFFGKMPKDIGIPGKEPGRMRIFRMDESTKVINTKGKLITLPKGEEYRTIPVYDQEGNLVPGKITLVDGKEVTVYTGELNKLKGKIIGEPTAGGMTRRGQPKGFKKDKFYELSGYKIPLDKWQEYLQIIKKMQEIEVSYPTSIQILEKLDISRGELHRELADLALMEKLKGKEIDSLSVYHKEIEKIRDILANEAEEILRKISSAGIFPMAGGMTPENRRMKRKEKMIEWNTPDITEQLLLSEKEFLAKYLDENKTLKKIAEELGEDIEDVKNTEMWVYEHMNEVVEQLRAGIEEAGDQDLQERKNELKTFLRNKLNPSLKEEGEYVNLKLLPWLWAKEGGVRADELTELSSMGFPVEGSNEIINLIENYFSKEIQERAQMMKYPAPKIAKPKKVKIIPIKQETHVGKGTVLNTRQEINGSEQREISYNMPFTLLGNKAEVLARLSPGLKNEITKDVEEVYDLFGGAKGYRVGLFSHLPSEKYNLNELSDERYNYYINIQDPQKAEIIIKTVKELRDGLIDILLKEFDLPQDKVSPEYIRWALNKWLDRATQKEGKNAYIFVKQKIDKYGQKLLDEAANDAFRSPRSSAIYYFLQNTSIFGIVKGKDGKYHWSQGVIRTSQERSKIRDSMHRIEEVSKMIKMESGRDKSMPITQIDGWQRMDEIYRDIKSGATDPKKIAVLVDPQYLNPTAKEGTYTVGQQDATWEGHKKNLEEHLLPLIKTGAKIIYTNNEDINLIKWLKSNKLPYNIELNIGQVAKGAGRDEILSLINYKLPEVYSGGGATYLSGLQPGESYLGEEITGESETFKEWLAEEERLRKEGLQRIPSFGKDWTSEQRRRLYILAMQRGVIYKNFEGKVADALHPLLRYYKGATYDQMYEYIYNLTGGSSEWHPRLFKLYGDITKDTEALKIIAREKENWRDINRVEVNTLDVPRTIEKVTRQPIWESNSLADNVFHLINTADDAMMDRRAKEHEDLDAHREGIMGGSKESAELMRKFEKGEPLTDKEKRVVAYLRQKYDALIKEANEMRVLLGRKPIPYRKDYMTHIWERNLLHEMFQGDYEKMANVSPAQLDALRKGDYVKANLPFNPYALRRMGEKTRYDAIGNYLRYLNTMLREIYSAPAINHARRFIDYALDKFPNAYKSMDRFLNDIRGKTSIQDQGAIGTFAGSYPIKWMRRHIARSALVGNINFWAINLSNFSIAYDELGNYLNVGLERFLGSKEWRKFAFDNSIMLKGRAIDPDFVDKVMSTKIEEAVGAITNIIEYNNVGSVFIGAYFKAIDELGYSKKKAIIYADAIARRTQVGYKKHELNAWMRSNSGMLLSQFQSWTFNAMNHILYDLGAANIPKEVLAKIQGKKLSEPDKARWGAMIMLLITSIMINALYDWMKLRKPYTIEAIFPTIAGLTPGRYGKDIGPLRILGDIKSALLSKEPKTRKRAAIRAGTALMPTGTQMGRFISGRVFPEYRGSTQEKTSIRRRVTNKRRTTR